MAETLRRTKMESMSPAILEELETEKLNQAFLCSVQEGDPLPLIKEELKYLIQSRRLADGKEELNVNFHPPQRPKLEPEDKIKRKKRREQNKNAAQRFRNKRKMKKENGKNELDFLSCRKSELCAQVEDLERQVQMYRRHIGNSFEQDGLHIQTFPPN
ncbi:cyclic AMP-dependent transcription factor ATF-3-like [Mizuhopecten yessoensis]|uniref:Activating transcription factor of chaperone n=1 Tax=Mizuhopecten yessoensis TaxID=6573 RepID=A0A210QNN7_MIZYE|nr:cyclic AMP-dependent transcription factor ATF-3-like [Mizuhopecten yessoensis]OWF50325.1 Activating transcription factor of chaperone [Mizuhopecten yessoensis]